MKYWLHESMFSWLNRVRKLYGLWLHELMIIAGSTRMALRYIIQWADGQSEELSVSELQALGFKDIQDLEWLLKRFKLGKLQRIIKGGEKPHE